MSLQKKEINDLNLQLQDLMRSRDLPPQNSPYAFLHSIVFWKWFGGLVIASAALVGGYSFYFDTWSRIEKLMGGPVDLLKAGLDYIRGPQAKDHPEVKPFTPEYVQSLSDNLNNLKRKDE